MNNEKSDPIERLISALRERARTCQNNALSLALIEVAKCFEEVNKQYTPNNEGKIQ